MATTEGLAIAGGTRTIPEGAHRTWPEVTDAERAALNGVLDRGSFAGANAPEITALQKEYADYIGVDYCLATNSGTAALHCAAAGVGVQPGDEVIVPAHTFVATAMAMAHHGATVVFADIDERTYNIDPAAIEPLITERTRAVVAVAIHGQPADLDEIIHICDRHGIAVIEDSAQCHGIDYRGRRTGSIGRASATSLNQSKNLSAGEGGLFTTNDETAYIVARRLCVFGEDLVPLEQRAFWSHGIGWNYRNQELSCAFARAQLPRLDRYNERAQENATILTTRLAGLDGVTPPYVADDRGCSYWKYAVQLEPEAFGFTGDPRDLRDRILQALRAEGVEAMVWQPQPIPAQPAFRRPQQVWHPRAEEIPLRPWDPQEFPVASRLCDTTLNLATETHPLYLQDPGLMELYCQAFAKVLANIDEVLDAPFTPTRRML
jgi:dTDP-4-amino-4,6-dideoxygalactose transaminase